MILSFALLDLGLASSSSFQGIMGFFVTFFATDSFFVLQVKSSISSLVYVLNMPFTSLSSKEWKVIQAIVHQIPSSFMACARESSMLQNSSFTAILKAWKTLTLDFGSKLDESINSASSLVVDMGFLTLDSNIALTMNGVFFSSQYS